MNSHAIDALRNKVISLENRLASLEAFVMIALGGEIKSTEQFDNLEAVRGFLAKVEIPDLPAPTVEFLTDRLTVDWRHLVKLHGFPIVFRMLRDGFSVPEVRRSLK
jgi:hypothetical protein